MASSLNHWQGDRIGTWRNASGSVALGHVQLANTPESLGETQPFFHAASRLAITADARIDNREDLLARLDIPHPHRASIPDSQLILKAYEKWGSGCCERLLGDFTFAIWDDGEKRLFCARDHLGIKPMFYSLSAEVFLFATEMKGIFRVRDLPRTLDPRWIADMLTVSVADKEYTCYPDIRRLPPAHWLSISATEFRMGTYWSLDPEKEMDFPSEDDCVEAFRELLTEAVRCRVRSAFPVGSELSGGLDSSAVTALAAQHARAWNIELVAFSNVLTEADRVPNVLIGDEGEYQDMLRRHAGITRSVGLASQNRGILESLKRTLFVQDGPPLRSFGTFFDILYEAGEREGVRTLLSGFGGDEGVSAAAGERLSELARQRAWKTLWQEYRRQAPGGRKFPLQSLLKKMAGEYFPFLKTASENLLDKRLKAKMNSLSAQRKTYALAPGFYQTAEIQRRLAAPLRMPREGRVRELQCRRLMLPQLTLRLEYCSLAAASRRLEYRYPLLDIRLLEFHLAVPSRWKRKNGHGRYLFRRAIEGTVPPAIQWRPDKCGATNPAVPRRFVRDGPEIEDLIVRSRQGPGACYLDLDQLLKRRDHWPAFSNQSSPSRQGAYTNALLLLMYLSLDP